MTYADELQAMRDQESRGNDDTLAMQLAEAQEWIAALEADLETDKRLVIEAQKQQERLAELEIACKVALDWMSNPDLIALVMGGSRAALIGDEARFGMGLAADVITKQLRSVLDHAQPQREHKIALDENYQIKPKSIRLSNAEKTLLLRVATHEDRGKFYLDDSSRERASLRRLELRGLVFGNDNGAQEFVGYGITAKGRAALKALQS